MIFNTILKGFSPQREDLKDYQKPETTWTKDTTGYSVVENTLELNGFNVEVQCATGYRGLEVIPFPIYQCLPSW